MMAEQSRTVDSSENNLGRLSELAEELVRAQEAVEDAEDVLKTAQRRVRQLAQFDLPEAMDDVGMAEFKTASGLVVTVKDDVQAGDLKRYDGLEWLRAEGEAGCIKTLVGIPFTAGSAADADELVERLAGEGIAATKTEVVNNQTLKALIRRKLADGVDVPMQSLGANPIRVARVKQARR